MKRRKIYSIVFKIATNHKETPLTFDNRYVGASMTGIHKQLIKNTNSTLHNRYQQGKYFTDVQIDYKNWPPIMHSRTESRYHLSHYKWTDMRARSNSIIKC